MAVVTGVRIKTDYALLVAGESGGEAAVLEKRAIEVGGMIELLELVAEPHKASIDWLYSQQRWILKQRDSLA